MIFNRLRPRTFLKLPVRCPHEDIITKNDDNFLIAYRKGTAVKTRNKLESVFISYCLWVHPRKLQSDG